jgi:hypothetical protein
MADPLQPPLPQPPNWGAYVAGQDTIGYYYQQEADEAAVAEYFFAQKVKNPENENAFLAAVVDNDGATTPGIGQITGQPAATGETTLGGANTVATRSGKGNIPNSLPGGYTP